MIPGHLHISAGLAVPPVAIDLVTLAVAICHGDGIGALVTIVAQLGQGCIIVHPSGFTGSAGFAGFHQFPLTAVVPSSYDVAVLSIGWQRQIGSAIPRRDTVRTSSLELEGFGCVHIRRNRNGIIGFGSLLRQLYTIFGVAILYLR